MKKIYLIAIMMFFINQAEAQLVDLMGSMAVEGALTTQSAQQVGRAHQQVLLHQFIQAMDLKNTEIFTSGLSDYNSLPISRVSAGGITATFQGEGNFYKADFSNMTPALCRLLLSHQWPNAVEVRFSMPTGPVIAPFGATDSNQCDLAKSITLIFQ